MMDGVFVVSDYNHCVKQTKVGSKHMNRNVYLMKLICNIGINTQKNDSRREPLRNSP